MTAPTTPPTTPSTGEQADLLSSLDRQRGFLRQTVDGLTDAQLALTPTASTLCLGGLIKHTGATERQWTSFLQHGADAFGEPIDMSAVDWANPDPAVAAMMAARDAEFSMLPEDTAASVLAGYAEVAAETRAVVTAATDLDLDHALPAAPWFEPGARWTLRRVLLHVIAETAQHAGHADILRESIDGQKTMG